MSDHRNKYVEICNRLERLGESPTVGAAEGPDKVMLHCFVGDETLIVTANTAEEAIGALNKRIDEAIAARDAAP
jgi:hypothetical protein